MRRLMPDPGETSISEQLESYRPGEDAPAERPFVAMNFVATLDGRATIDGRSGAIGSRTDTAMMTGLRERFDAVMVGAGTKRIERYEGLGKRLVVVRSENGKPADLPALLGSLREDGVRAVMCEGGPTLHGSLQAEGLVDELFLTISPKLADGTGPRILEGALPEVVEMELAWLLEEDGELFARYRRS